GAALPARRAVRRAREAQDPVRVHIAVEGIDGRRAAHAAGADDGYLTIERDPFLVNERYPTELFPAAVRVLRRSDPDLSLAVVSQTPRLEDTGNPYVTQRPFELRARCDRPPARRRDRQPLEEPLLRNAVLRGGQRRDGRADARAVGCRRVRAQRIDGDVLQSKVSTAHSRASRESSFGSVKGPCST